MTQAEDMQRESDRYALGVRILEVSQNSADAYRRNISRLNTAEENTIAERCAGAASNTGVFILQALGYSSEHIKQFITARMAIRTEHMDGSVTIR